MDLKTLKQHIEDKSIQVGFLIFKYIDNDFLPNQYVKSIADIKGVELEYIDDFSIITNSFFDLACL